MYHLLILIQPDKIGQDQPLDVSQDLFHPAADHQHASDVLVEHNRGRSHQAVAIGGLGDPRVLVADPIAGLLQRARDEFELGEVAALSG
ncbi:MAG: hypothetical protein P8X64_03590 [Anaerolineales bacterium]